MEIEDLRIKLGHIGIPNNGNYYALKEMDKNPNKLAIKFPNLVKGKILYEELTFGQFRQEALKISNGFLKEGFKKGDRVILLFPVSVDLYLTIFACFYNGIIPVFLDSSMGTKKLVQAIRDSKAKGIISIDKLLKLKVVIPALWFKKSYCIDNNKWCYKSFNTLRNSKSYEGGEEKLPFDYPALITFTSGSTGRPKGANRSIDILLNQKIVSEYFWPHEPGEIDLPAFPMIVLQNLGCGVSSILPAINFQNYLEMDASIVTQQIRDEQITRFSAQPFFIENLCDYIISENVKLPKLRSIVVGGAIVSKPLCRKIIKAFPGVECNIVYGSTEAEPISHTSVEQFLKESGTGVLVGRPVDVLKIKILENVPRANVDDNILSTGVGEIILSGPHVIKEYLDNHIANVELKLKSKNAQIWHRTGDLGYFDDKGNLWLVGRIKDQIESLSGVIPCYDLEEEILQINGVKKAAFIDQKKILFIESLENVKVDKAMVNKFLKEKELSNFEISFIDKLPVDQRHFSRVDRAKLRL